MAGGHERHDQRERNADVVDLALQEAERTGLHAEHVLEEIGPRNDGHAADGDDQRGRGGVIGTDRTDGRGGHDSP